MKSLSNQAKKEMLKLSKSDSLRKSFEKLNKNRFNPFLVNGKFNLDKVVEFLTDFNKFINHKPKTFRKITGNNFKI